MAWPQWPQEAPTQKLLDRVRAGRRVGVQPTAASCSHCWGGTAPVRRTDVDEPPAWPCPLGPLTPSPTLCGLGPVPFSLWASGFYSRLLRGCSWCLPSPSAPTLSHEPWAGEGLVLAGVKRQCLPAAWLLNLNPGAWRGQSSPADLAGWLNKTPRRMDGRMDTWTDRWTHVDTGTSRGRRTCFLPSAHPPLRGTWLSG